VKEWGHQGEVKEWGHQGEVKEWGHQGEVKEWGRRHHNESCTAPCRQTRCRRGKHCCMPHGNPGDRRSAEGSEWLEGLALQ